MLTFTRNLPHTPLASRGRGIPSEAVCGAVTYSEPGFLTTGYRNGKLGYSRQPREEIAHIPKSNRMPDAPHSVKVETQVVDGIKNLGKYLVGRIQVPEVGARVPPAHPARAIRVERTLIGRVTGLLNRDFSLGREQQSVPRRAGRQHAIHHIDAQFRIFDNLFGRSHSHEIARPV